MRKRRACITALYCAALFLAVECTFRCYLAFFHGVPFFRPSDLMLNHYPELRIAGGQTGTSSNEYRILLLGGSVLNEQYGQVQSLLESKLRARGVSPCRIDNLSRPAHTSRDSYLKYKALAAAKYDLIVLYHGLNDVRANNCPPEVFRQDYSHYGWYELRNLADRHAAVIDLTVIPYTMEYLYRRLKQTFTGSRYIPVHAPDPEWMQYGDDIKTTASFGGNIGYIVQHAGNRDRRVIVMTFAYYIPGNYRLEEFRTKSLDYAYGSQSYPIELWGHPASVAKGLQSHNSVIRGLARDHASLVFIDMEKLLPKQGTYFADICHLTGRGSDLFAETLSVKIAGLYQEWKGTVERTGGLNPARQQGQ